MINKKRDISIIIPVYNEAANLLDFINRTTDTMVKNNLSYEIIFAVDPCTDDSEQIVKKEIQKNKNIRMILFSRKFGQQIATMAGIQNCIGESCVVIDCDLQDPPEIIIALYHTMKKGFDVVYAKRVTRAGETFIKKIISKIGYYIINKITDANIPRDAGDFRIISKRVINELKKIKGNNFFLRGLVSHIGYKQTFIEYDRKERFGGQSKYNKYFGSFKIAFDGIFGFSSRPLYLMFILGIFLSLTSFILAIYYLFQKFFTNITPGLSSTVILISFFSGVQLFCLGLLGEYVGRIYDEVKKYPTFVIDQKINFDE
jgi:dolichol-phosphate mannosyltransferase